MLVERRTSHYFSLCSQMPLATLISFAKGRNKGACHRAAFYPCLLDSLPHSLLTSNLTPISPNHPQLGRLTLFLSSSLNYWKQNGLRTKTQADVGWLIMLRPTDGHAKWKRSRKIIITEDTWHLLSLSPFSVPILYFALHIFSPCFLEIHIVPESQRTYQIFSAL